MPAWYGNSGRGDTYDLSADQGGYHQGLVQIRSKLPSHSQASCRFHMLFHSLAITPLQFPSFPKEK